MVRPPHVMLRTIEHKAYDPGVYGILFPNLGGRFGLDSPNGQLSKNLRFVRNLCSRSSKRVSFISSVFNSSTIGCPSSDIPSYCGGLTNSMRGWPLGGCVELMLSDSVPARNSMGWGLGLSPGAGSFMT